MIIKTLSSIRPLYLLFGSIIVVLYLVLRIGWPETIEFGYDQPKVAIQVQRFISHGNFLTSHEFNDITPFGNFSWSSAFIFLNVPFFLLSSHPIILSQLIGFANILSVVVVIYVGWKFFSPSAGLLAGFFLSVQPWWIVFSRMVYSPSFGPSLISICILLTFIVIENSKTRLIALLIFLWGVLAQIYINHFSTIFVSLVAVAITIGKGLRWRYVLYGVLATFILFIPVIYYYSQHLDMFFAYFGAQSHFKTESISLTQRFIELVTLYFSVLSGGSFTFQLGTSYSSFLTTFGLYPQITRIFEFITLIVILYSAVSVLKSSTSKRMHRILLLFWATGPVWFLMIIRVPEIVPRYFLLCMPAYSILLGIAITELIAYIKNKSLRVIFFSSIIALYSIWIFFIISYYGFISHYSYPSGFISYISDPPSIYAEQAVNWIDTDSGQKKYSSVVLGGTPTNPTAFDIPNAPRYYWEYVLHKQFDTIVNSKTGYYSLYYSPLRESDIGKEYRQFGPYIAIDETLSP